MNATTTIRIVTRGSALALAQSNMVLQLCRKSFPDFAFELKIVKTTGDKLQTASMSAPAPELPKGLFTKEIEEALLNKEGDIAVHSLKDLPTELPPGLVLGAVTKRADVRDVLIYRSEQFAAPQANEDWAPGQKPQWRGYKRGLQIRALPEGAVIATSSTRREAQARQLHPSVKFTAIRGNVGTRLQKLASQGELDATILAAAGMGRLGFTIFPDGKLKGEGVPDNLLASFIETEDMLPCVGQGAVGIERRDGDERSAEVCEKLNHFGTWQAVLAERAFLQAMGGGCQSPVGAYGRVIGHQLSLEAVTVTAAGATRAAGQDLATEPLRLGRAIAAQLPK